MAEYDDDTFLRLLNDLQQTLSELLDMDGNTEASVREEVDNILRELAA